MAVIETWLAQDLKEPVQVKQLCGNFFSHNGNGNRIGVNVFDNGSPATLSGTVSGYAVLKDGTTVPCTGSLSGNQASVLLPAAAYVPGNIFVTIMLTSGTTITTLAALTGTVVMARTDTQVDPGSVVTDWTNTINAALQTVEGYTGNIIATPYASLTYPVPLGKYCIYNNLLYRCVSPIASSESWTASHWTQVKLADDVSDLKSAFDATICPVAWTPSIRKGEYIDFVTGRNAVSNKYARTVSLCGGYRERIAVAVTDTTYEYVVSYYNASGNVSTGAGFLGHTDYLQGETYIPSTALMIGLTFRRTDQATLADSDVTAISAALKCYAPTDISLTENGMPADAKVTGDKMNDINNGYTVPVANVNGSYAATGPTTGSTTRIRTELIPVKKGCIMTINNGSLKHGVAIWKDSVSSTNNIRNDGSWNTSNETVEFAYDGYCVVAFAKQTDSQTISPSDYDGEIKNYSNQIGKNANDISAIKPNFAGIPPLFEGGMSSADGQFYHDSQESWLKNRVRTNVVYIHKGATFTNKSSKTYQVTICKYADYDVKNYIETIASTQTVNTWACPADGYYTVTFKLSSSGNITIDDVKADIDFTNFYCDIDERIHVYWIGSGNSEETVTYTDSGDCSLVVFPDGTGLLIDGANARNYTSVRRRLAEAGFYHIKNIIISHFHDDHVGGLIQMVNDNIIDITGATVYLPDYDATLWAYNNGVMSDATKTMYTNMMSALNSNNCVLVYPDTDFEPYQIGGAVLEFFNTDLSVYEGTSTNYNDWSLCNYIFYGNMNICFSGDIGPIAQSELGGKLYKANVYKADHHGWLNYPTMPSDYINNISPDVIIALDGQVHDELLVGDNAPLIRWAEANGVPYYRKYQNNEIKMVVSKDSWAFESKTKRYFRPTT